MLTKVLLAIGFVVFSSYLSGQTPGDILDETYRPEVMFATFNRSFPDHHTRKIRGRAYMNPYLSAPEHQFFKSKASMEGLVFTANDTIQCADVFYDLHREKLLVYVEKLFKLIELDESFVEHFILYESISGETFEFVKLKEGGFHQKIHEGKSYALYKKHTKSYKQKARQGRYFDGFDEYEQLIIRKDGSFVPIRRNKDLLALFQEEETSLKKYLRRSHVKINRVSDHQARALMQYLEEAYPGHGTEIPAL